MTLHEDRSTRGDGGPMSQEDIDIAKGYVQEVGSSNASGFFVIIKNTEITDETHGECIKAEGSSKVTNTSTARILDTVMLALDIDDAKLSKYLLYRSMMSDEDKGITKK